MKEEIKKFRKQASLHSKGTSGEEIYNEVIAQILSYYDTTSALEILDLGCGEGNMLKIIENVFPNFRCTGADYIDFTDRMSTKATFVRQDFNQDFATYLLNRFDLVIVLEIIEHLENGRHLFRQVLRSLKKGGRALVSTPNVESIRSIISYIVRGHHSAFGPKDYPAHISYYTEFDLKNILGEIGQLNLEKIVYIKNGRIPGSKLQWKKIIPFLSGKRFSDNFLLIFNKS